MKQLRKKWNKNIVYPVNPSTVSSIGRIWTRLAYLTSGHGWILKVDSKKCYFTRLKVKENV